MPAWRLPPSASSTKAQLQIRETKPGSAMESRCQLLWQLLAAVCSPTEETSYSLSSIIEQAGSGMEGSVEEREERQSHAWHAASGLFQKSVHGTFRAYTLTHMWKHMHSHNEEFSLVLTETLTHILAHVGVTCFSLAVFFFAAWGQLLKVFFSWPSSPKTGSRRQTEGPGLTFSVYSSTLHVSVALRRLYRWMFYIYMKICWSITRKKGKHTDLFSDIWGSLITVRLQKSVGSLGKRRRGWHLTWQTNARLLWACSFTYDIPDLEFSLVIPHERAIFPKFLLWN